MGIRHHDLGEPVIPTPHEVALAEASSRVLAQHLPTRPADVQLRLVADGQETETITVPATVLTLFLRLLREIARGHAVALLPLHGWVRRWHRYHPLPEELGVRLAPHPAQAARRKFQVSDCTP